MHPESWRFRGLYPWPRYFPAARLGFAGGHGRVELQPVYDAVLARHADALATTGPEITRQVRTLLDIYRAVHDNVDYLVRSSARNSGRRLAQQLERGSEFQAAREALSFQEQIEFHDAVEWLRSIDDSEDAFDEDALHLALENPPSFLETLLTVALASAARSDPLLTRTARPAATTVLLPKARSAALQVHPQSQSSPSGSQRQSQSESSRLGSQPQPQPQSGGRSRSQSRSPSRLLAAHAAARSIEELLTCKICFTTRVDRVLLPCGHLLCHTCEARVRACPFCKKQVESRHRIFFA